MCVWVCVLSGSRDPSPSNGFGEPITSRIGSLLESQPSCEWIVFLCPHVCILNRDDSDHGMEEAGPIHLSIAQTEWNEYKYIFAVNVTKTIRQIPAFAIPPDRPFIICIWIAGDHQRRAYSVATRSRTKCKITKNNGKEAPLQFNAKWRYMKTRAMARNILG